MANRVKHRANTRNIAGILSQATFADLENGIHWYDRALTASQALADEYAITTAQAAGVISSLSPNNKWQRNVYDADRLIRATIDDKQDDVKVCTFGLNKVKALKIMDLAFDDSYDESTDVDTISAILNGQKVTAFFRCIMGDTDTVCVDGHAFAIYKGQRIPTSKTPNIGKGLYLTIQRSYQLVADRSADIVRHKLTPSQVQAVTWVTYRRMLKDA